MFKHLSLSIPICLFVLVIMVQKNNEELKTTFLSSHDLVAWFGSGSDTAGDGWFGTISHTCPVSGLGLSWNGRVVCV
jgi:hypothetical protein